MYAGFLHIIIIIASHCSSLYKYYVRIVHLELGFFLKASISLISCKDGFLASITLFPLLDVVCASGYNMHNNN